MNPAANHGLGTATHTNKHVMALGTAGCLRCPGWSVYSSMCLCMGVVSMSICLFFFFLNFKAASTAHLPIQQ